MAERPRRTVKIREFSGMVSNRGPLVGRPSDAKLLINCRSISPGVLEVRGGMRPLQFRS